MVVKPLIFTFPKKVLLLELTLYGKEHSSGPCIFCENINAFSRIHITLQSDNIYNDPNEHLKKQLYFKKNKFLSEFVFFLYSLLLFC